MILIPGGRKCYCGKVGCTDAYCAESVLTDDNRISLETFMTQVKNKDAAAGVKWENYLDHLAILIKPEDLIPAPVSAMHDDVRQNCLTAKNTTGSPSLLRQIHA